MKLSTVSSGEIFKGAKSSQLCNSHQESACERIQIALRRVIKSKLLSGLLTFELLQWGVKVRMTQMKFCLKDEDHSQVLFSSWVQEELHVPCIKADCGLSDQKSAEWGILQDIQSWLRGSGTVNYLPAIQHHVPEDRIDANLQFVGNQCWKLNPGRQVLQKRLLSCVNIGFYLPPYELENLFFLCIFYILLKRKQGLSSGLIYTEKDGLQMSIRSNEVCPMSHNHPSISFLQQTVFLLPWDVRFKSPGDTGTGHFDCGFLPPV